MNRITGIMLLSVMAVMLAAAWAPAASCYWDINGATSGAGGAGAPGGAWDDINTYWNSDPAGGAGTFVASSAGVDDLFLSAGTDATGRYTIVLSGSKSAASLTVSSGMPTLSGGALNLGSTLNVRTGALTIANGHALAIAGTAGYLYLGSNVANVAVNVNTGSVWLLGSNPVGSAGAYGDLQLNVGYGADATNCALQIDGGVVSNIFRVIMDYSCNLISITNGGQFHAGNGGASGDWSVRLGGRSNSVVIAGSNSIWNLGSARMYLGQAGTVGNSLRVERGGLLRNGYLFTYGTDTSVTVTNGGRLSLSGLWVGRGGLSNSFVVAGSDEDGNQSIVNNGGTSVLLGCAASGSTNNWVCVGQGGVLTNLSSVMIGGSSASDTNAVGNYMAVVAGGRVFSKADNTIGFSTNDNANGVYVDGSGSIWNLGAQSLTVGCDPAVTDNYVHVSAGGVITNMRAFMVSASSELRYSFSSNGAGFVSCEAYTNRGRLALNIKSGMALFATNVFGLLGASSFDDGTALTNAGLFGVFRSGSVLQASLSESRSAQGSRVVYNSAFVLSPTNAGWLALQADATTNSFFELPLAVETNGASHTISQLVEYLGGAGVTASNRTAHGFNLFLYLARPAVETAYFAWDFTDFDPDLRISQGWLGPPPEGTVMLVK